MSWDTLMWTVARAGGFTALLLASAAVALGLALAMRRRPGRLSRPAAIELHRYLTTLTLGFLAVHLAGFLLDQQARMGLTALVVPGVATRNPVAVALGIVAVEVGLAIGLSALVRPAIGYRAWRRLHGLTFLVWGLALLHGILNGSDTGRGWSALLYLAAAAPVAVLGIMRLARRRGRTPARVPARKMASPPSGLPPLR